MEEPSWRSLWPLLLIPLGLAVGWLAVSLLDDDLEDPTWGAVEEVQFDYVYEGS